VGGIEVVDGIYSTGSFHEEEGGVNVGFADGSVQFLTEGIDAGDARQSPLTIEQMASGGIPSPYGAWGLWGWWCIVYCGDCPRILRRIRIAISWQASVAGTKCLCIRTNYCSARLKYPLLRTFTHQVLYPPGPLPIRSWNMLDVYLSLIQNQYDAVFRTLKHCLDGCTNDAWSQLVCNQQINQVVFHTLFFADLYLGPNPESIEHQAFHTEHNRVFSGYEEMENRAPENEYERPFLEAYLQHCRDKCERVIGEMTAESLAEPSGFDWIHGSMGEVHVYNIRHIQHHAAQLSLRLRLSHEFDVPWVKSGWFE
jgi:prepilin-type processing-associated H-X9-DG protein